MTVWTPERDTMLRRLNRERKTIAEMVGALGITAACIRRRLDVLEIPFHARRAR